MRSVKVCGSCGEIMPMSERLCYCGGPIKIERVESERAAQADSYRMRKWLRSK